MGPSRSAETMKKKKHRERESVCVHERERERKQRKSEGTREGGGSHVCEICFCNDLKFFTFFLLEQKSWAMGRFWFLITPPLHASKMCKTWINFLITFYFSSFYLFIYFCFSFSYELPFPSRVFQIFQLCARGSEPTRFSILLSHYQFGGFFNLRFFKN